VPTIADPAYSVSPFVAAVDITAHQVAPDAQAIQDAQEVPSASNTTIAPLPLENSQLAAAQSAQVAPANPVNAALPIPQGPPTPVVQPPPPVPVLTVRPGDIIPDYHLLLDMQFDAWANHPLGFNPERLSMEDWLFVQGSIHPRSIPRRESLVSWTRGWVLFYQVHCYRALKQTTTVPDGILRSLVRALDTTMIAQLTDVTMAQLLEDKAIIIFQ
jgi:hypothetical protein